MLSICTGRPMHTGGSTVVYDKPSEWFRKYTTAELTHIRINPWIHLIAEIRRVWSVIRRRIASRTETYRPRGMGLTHRRGRVCSSRGALTMRLSLSDFVEALLGDGFVLAGAGFVVGDGVHGLVHRPT